ncbi:MAG TPA: glycogen debranching N-terminal domain-containing protein, partial [Ktedonobacteraceae bacterium]
NACQIDMTNKAMRVQDIGTIEQGEIHVQRNLELQYEQLVQTLTITSFHAQPLSLTMGFKLGTDFSDLFEVRGEVRKRRGEQYLATNSNEQVTMIYQGLDQVERKTELEFSPRAHHIQDDRIYWNVQLQRNQPLEIQIVIKMSESNEIGTLVTPRRHPWHDLPQPGITTENALFNRLLKRGQLDLMMLSTMTPQGYYPYAGIPWFCCPFGRDGLITCLEFLPWYPEIVRGALSFLAFYQGKKHDAFTDEEPGKMLHEFRTGEMANMREIPYIPYYGSVDVTPLFLITLEAYIRWTNDQEFLQQMWPHAEAAASWLINYGDRDGDTFIEYHKGAETGITNQGWKDAHDSVSHNDGRLARSPIALCEVQGYAYAAYRGIAYLAEKLGKEHEATTWTKHAETIQKNFLERFWWPEEQVFAMALDENKQPCHIVTSNTGQCLWTGIVPEEYAQKVVSRLTQEDMSGGWGIRTLSAQAARYNPMSYHNGSIWPHDNALVGLGFARHGRKEETADLLQKMFAASQHYDDARLPELYCGFTRDENYGPTRYPVACAPQGWAAGAPFLLLNGLLGLTPLVEENCLILDRPTLPAWLGTLEIANMQINGKQIHLRLTRAGEHTEVIVEPDSEVEIRIL